MVTTILYSNQKLNWETGEFDTSYLSNNYCYFELIEDNNIDIDSIEEFSKADDIDWCYPSNENIQKLGLKMNETIRAIKHLNKEIQSIKEK